jgi:hypothetical protein
MVIHYSSNEYNPRKTSVCAWCQTVINDPTGELTGKKITKQQELDLLNRGIYVSHGLCEKCEKDVMNEGFEIHRNSL